MQCTMEKQVVKVFVFVLWFCSSLGQNYNFGVENFMIPKSTRESQEKPVIVDSLRLNSNKINLKKPSSVASPFFFLCHMSSEEHGYSAPDHEVTLTLKVAGNGSLSEGYEPQKVYEVIVESSEVVDGFLLTGAHFLTTEFSKTNHFSLPPSIENQNSAGLVCSIVHRHVSMEPRHEFVFLWMAPPSGTGCVQFLATGSLQDALVFKDALIREVCEKKSEETADLKAYSSPFIAKQQNGFVIRDDINSHELEKNIWAHIRGGYVSEERNSKNGAKLHSMAGEEITMETSILDFSEAERIQYTVGKGRCKDGGNITAYLGEIVGDGMVEEKLESSNGANEKVLCDSWMPITNHGASKEAEVHILSVPSYFRKKGVCFKLQSLPLENSCFLLDNVAISEINSKLSSLVDEFDPVNPQNWMFLSGGDVTESCGSEGRAAVFTSSEDASLTSRPMHLLSSFEEEDIVLQKTFGTDALDGWIIIGKEHVPCNPLNLSGFRMVSAEQRKICSPELDLTTGELMTLRIGTDYCKESRNIDLTVAFNGKDSQTSHSVHLSSGLASESIAVPLSMQVTGTSFCLEQNEISEEGVDAWVIYEVRITPRISTKPQHYLQTFLNPTCGEGEAQIQFEASTSGGRTWSPLHLPCSSELCDRNIAPSYMFQNTIGSKGWTLATIPLPFFALTENTMFRIRKISSDEDNPGISWAVDNIFIGQCPGGCSGHGACQSKNMCKCEYGWSGEKCEISDRKRPFYLSEPFSTSLMLSANILRYSGGKVSYKCGVVGSGEAAVYDGDGPRFLTTVDVDTTKATFLQFNFQAGTKSEVGKCPGSKDPKHRIMIHYSCSGGSFWHLLGSLKAVNYKSPSHVTFRLPPSAKEPACRFEIWQPEHSGLGKDMWAIDDLTLNSESYNTIELPFTDVENSNQSLRFHLGKIGTFCNKKDVLYFTGINENGLVRFMETRSIGIGPSFMVQFDLKIGCHDNFSDSAIDSTIALEYSLTHGLTWNTVHKPCTSSKPGCDLHFTRGTTYHSSEFSDWKRVTLVLPQHTWSSTARLRLRQLETTESGLPWAVDNFYVGYQCPGMCSGHGYCSAYGCRCDTNFHGHLCLPVHKLNYKIDTEFEDEIEIENYGFQFIGGHRVSGSQGCGQVLSGHSIYFGEPGVRQFETDDMKIEFVDKIMFYLVIGGGHGQQKNCQSGTSDSFEEENLSFGSLVLEYSIDGGITWTLLKELSPEEYRNPKYFQMELLDEVLPKSKLISQVVRFRLWQPNHKLKNQWAIDAFKVLPKKKKKTLQADLKKGALLVSPWLSSSEHSQKEYCHSRELAIVLSSVDPIRMAVTDVLSLDQGDIISFQISVGCKPDKMRGNPVHLEFSRDNGNTWNLVQDKCLPGHMDCETPVEPSIYHPGHHGPWTKVQIPVDHRLSDSDIHLRWIQQNPSKTPGEEFGLQKIYIGPPCEHDCSGHGLCKASGLCSCDEGFSGKFCEDSVNKNTKWLRDSFSDRNLDMKQWERIEGGVIGATCGNDPNEKALLFDGPHARFLTSKELDTRNTKFLVFNLKIGSEVEDNHCHQPEAPRDNVMLEYSTNNGLKWELLQEFEGYQTLNRHRPYFIALPRNSRTKQTKFRWWQTPSYMLEDSEDLTEWQIDNVFVLANETIDTELVYSNNISSKLWFMVSGAVKTNEAQLDRLTFSDQTGERYAETWDFMATEASAVQFDIDMKHHGKKSVSNVQVEYSVNNGIEWSLLKPTCDHPFRDCEMADLPSIFSPKTIDGRRRVTMFMPKAVRGRRTRVRIREVVNGVSGVDPKLEWTLENIYIGDKCPWMCSGHGYCTLEGCRCDEGFFGEFCVPQSVLPCEMVEKFESTANINLWESKEGLDISSQCGVLVHNNAGVLLKKSPRYLETTDLDMTAGKFIQFTLSSGCSSFSQNSFKNQYTEVQACGELHVLVQYSTDGGIQWNIIQDIIIATETPPTFISIKLRDFPEAKTNATRFRFWQPGDHDAMDLVWSLDNIYIGGLVTQPNVLYDDFNSGKPSSDAWIDSPAGSEAHLCGPHDSKTALSFTGHQVGEHALYTKDLHVDSNSVIQFDIKVGCGNTTAEKNSVQLQYSNDFGETWEDLRSACSPAHEICSWDLQEPSIYYPNALIDWTRVTIPLSCLPVCGPVRFRWWQGYYHEKEPGVSWGIDNVYIGPACEDNCNGHGYCINGDTCDCDVHFNDEHVCSSVGDRYQEISEDFEEGLDLNYFSRCSGSEITTQCPVISGESLVFWHQGERVLETTDLDVTEASIIEYYLRLGCAEPWKVESKYIKDIAILLSFSTDAGIHWHTISYVDSNKKGIDGLLRTSFHSVDVPDEARTNATRFRWWEPSTNGTFGTQWAIDEININNILRPQQSFYENGDGSEWKLKAGSSMKPYCGLSPATTMLDNEGIRFTETPDIRNSPSTMIQFEIGMGCKNTHCYDIALEYSIDYGRTWNLVRESCTPSNPDCSESWLPSVFKSDMHQSRSLVTFAAPKIARSNVARFRLVQKLPWKAENTWAVSRAYVGDVCKFGCYNRGVCTNGKCHCENGWTGDSCTDRTSKLKKYLDDDFSGKQISDDWNKVIGAKISNVCGSIASGSALHFYGGCSRLAETNDLDLEDAFFVQFDMKTGCSDQNTSSSLSRDNNVLVQVSCTSGITWKTIREIPIAFKNSKYIWIEIPPSYRCHGGRVRWWQPQENRKHNRFDWAIDSVVVGGKSQPPDSISLMNSGDLKAPLWIRRYNWQDEMFCKFNSTTPVMESSPSEAAIIQTTDIHISHEHSIHFSLALACESAWDNNIEPVRLEYSRDFGRTWQLVRTMCLPFETSSCNEYKDASIYYAPQKWQYYVLPLEEVGPSKYTRFRWIQRATPQTAGSHRWSLKDVYIGRSCKDHCLGRGKCISPQKCICDPKYHGTQCQNLIDENLSYIKDTFRENNFLDHWNHIQGGHTSSGCGGEIEEPPAAIFQGKHSRVLASLPIDTRSSRFVLFTAQIGSMHGNGLCGKATERIHNVFLQYSTNGGINWHLLRELDHTLYRKPQDDYIIMPRDAMTAATTFRFWQPQRENFSPSWAIDNVFIGGSEIAAAQFSDKFDQEPTVAEWLFAPHSHSEQNYCYRGDNGSLVWEADHPGHRAITTQELIVNDGHIVQFKISMGCNQEVTQCYNGPSVRLEYSKDGGISGWELLKGACFPETSHDPNCSPYVFNSESQFGPDLYSVWTRVTIPIPEKAWSSTTQIRWSQNANLNDDGYERILPWALDDVYVGVDCPEQCRGHGECFLGKCVCDPGYSGDTCEPVIQSKSYFVKSIIDGFEGKLDSNWNVVTGGSIGIGCNSLAPYGNGKHLYFNGCGMRQAITIDLDTRRAATVTFVLKIGSHEHNPSCQVDLSNPSTTGNKGVVLQYSVNNGIHWHTLSVHDPLDFRKARRVAYSLPENARKIGTQLRWWQPDHGGIGRDQWALDNVEVILNQRKSTNEYVKKTKLW